MKILYPDLVYGAVASSGEYNFPAYMSVGYPHTFT